MLTRIRKMEEERVKRKTPELKRFLGRNNPFKP